MRVQRIHVALPDRILDIREMLQQFFNVRIYDIVVQVIRVVLSYFKTPRIFPSKFPPATLRDSRRSDDLCIVGGFVKNRCSLREGIKKNRHTA